MRPTVTFAPDTAQAERLMFAIAFDLTVACSTRTRWRRCRASRLQYATSAHSASSSGPTSRHGSKGCRLEPAGTTGHNEDEKTQRLAPQRTCDVSWNELDRMGTAEQTIGGLRCANPPYACFAVRSTSSSGVCC